MARAPNGGRENVGGQRIGSIFSLAHMSQLAKKRDTLFPHAKLGCRPYLLSGWKLDGMCWCHQEHGGAVACCAWIRLIMQAGQCIVAGGTNGDATYLCKY